MSRKSKLVLVFAGAALFTCGYLVAQNKTPTAAEIAASLTEPASQLTKMASKAEKDHVDFRKRDDPAVIEFEKRADELKAKGTALYKVAAGDPEVGPAYAQDVLQDYYLSMAYDAGTDRESRLTAHSSLRLQALTVAQNAKIIELLEKIAAKK